MKDHVDLPLFQWRAPPKVLVFPLTRRRDLVLRAARSMLTRGQELGARDPAATGEKMLAATLNRQRRVMTDRGIEPEVIDQQIEALERAIRIEHARMLSTGAVA